MCGDWCHTICCYIVVVRWVYLTLVTYLRGNQREFCFGCDSYWCGAVQKYSSWCLWIAILVLFNLKWVMCSVWVVYWCLSSWLRILVTVTYLRGTVRHSHFERMCNDKFASQNMFQYFRFVSTTMNPCVKIVNIVQMCQQSNIWCCRSQQEYVELANL